MTTLAKFDPKSEKLKIQSSVYPEGYGTTQGYNALYNEIYNSDKKKHDTKNQAIRNGKIFYN